MYAKTMNFKDFNGVDHKQILYFHLSKFELTKLDSAIRGNLIEKLTKAAQENSVENYIRFIDMIVSMSFGEKSEDGLRFVKSKEATDAFKQTMVYDLLMDELIGNEVELINFLKGTLPVDIVSHMMAALPDTQPPAPAEVTYGKLFSV